LTMNQGRPPDLLRRFVATPYVFTNDDGPNRLSVRSNDLEIALAIRRHWINLTCETRPSVLSWKVLRDVAAPDNFAKLSILYDKNLRTLVLGTRAILYYDIERSEILGFLSAKTTVKQLVSSLIPMLLEL
jgi:hypothetical protein